MAFVMNGDSGISAQQRLVDAKAAAAAKVNSPYTQPKTATLAAPAVTKTKTGTAQPTAESYKIASSPVTNSAPSASGGYTGMTPDEYRQSIIDAVTGGVMTEYEANAAIIKNNLAQALSNLDSELAALQPAYQNQLTNIAQNQFTSGEATKEIMNQGGWSASNSGLAIGEQTKIGVAADKSRGAALQAKTQTEADIERRRSLANQEYGTNLASLEAQKNAKLSAAQADAQRQSDERNRQIYEDDRNYNRSVYESDRAYAQSRASSARARASGGSSSKAATPATMTKTEANEWVSGVTKILESSYAEDRMAMYEEALADEEVPQWVRDMLQAQYGNKNKETENYYYNP